VGVERRVQPLQEGAPGAPVFDRLHLEPAADHLRGVGPLIDPRDLEILEDARTLRAVGAQLAPDLAQCGLAMVDPFAAADGAQCVEKLRIHGRSETKGERKSNRKRVRTRM